MAFDRSKYKAASLEVIKKEQQRAEMNAKEFYIGKQYAKFFSLKERGTYVFRILPAVEEGDSPYYALRTARLPMEMDVKDVKGNVTGKKWGTKSVFIASVHSEKYKVDPIEEYIRFVYELADSIQDKDEKKAFLSPISGSVVGGKWVFGMKPSTVYVCYAVDAKGEIGRLQLYENWMDEIHKISIEKSTDGVLSIDVFSDPDTGFPMKITKGYDPKSKKETTDVGCMEIDRTEDWKTFFERNKVPDAILEKLEELPSLHELYIDSYSNKEFDLAVKGLEAFDQQNGYGIFENAEFLDILEEISKNVPVKDELPEELPVEDEDAKAETELKEKKAVKAKAEKEKETAKTTRTTKAEKKAAPAAEPIKEEKAEVKYPSRSRMILALMNYADEKYEDESLINTDMDDETLKIFYDAMQEGDELPFENSATETGNEEAGESEDEAGEDPAPAKEEKSAKPLSYAEKLAQLRANMKK